MWTRFKAGVKPKYALGQAKVADISYWLFCDIKDAGVAGEFRIVGN